MQQATRPPPRALLIEGAPELVTVLRAELARQREHVQVLEEMLADALERERRKEPAPP